MRPFPLLLAALVAASCAPGRVPGPATPAATGDRDAEAGAAAICRIGPDGGPPAAGDRGIGGTGGPVRVADRGIGGTGAPATAGKNGAGILGVITGFASICLAGQEVGYGADLPVEVDGRPAGPEVLRAGQVVAVLAENQVATRLAVRHEVSGPVERRDADGTLWVAGQHVLPEPGLVAPEPGRWTRVSGFRRPDGAVVATRFEARPPGEVLVRGVVELTDGVGRIGALPVRPAPGQLLRVGMPVVAVGKLNGGTLEASTVELDALLVDPPAFFGPTAGTLVIEAYAVGGRTGFGGFDRIDLPVRDGRAVLRFDRGPGGRFAAAPGPAGGPPSGPAGRGAPGFAPAPMPNRGLERGANRFGTGGARSGEDGGRGRGEGRQGGIGRGQGQGGPDGSGGFGSGGAAGFAPGGFGGGGRRGER